MLNPDNASTHEIAAALREMARDATLMADSADNLQREFDAARAGAAEEPHNREWFENGLRKCEVIRHDCAVLVNMMGALRQRFIDRMGGIQHYHLPSEQWWDEEKMRPHIEAAKAESDYPFTAAPAAP